MSACHRCDHFAAGESDASSPPFGGEASIGICRRYPPRLIGEHGVSHFPSVNALHACGEFREEFMPI